MDRITIKFIEGSEIYLNQGSFNSRIGLDLSDINLILDQYGAKSLCRLFNQERRLLDRLKMSGEAKSGKELANLNLYYTVVLDSFDQSVELVNALLKSPYVETAYPKYRICLPFDIEPETPLYTDDQIYLYDAPEGLDAPAAWEIEGGMGEGVKIIDIEFGWTFEHEDFKEPFYERNQRIHHVDHGDAVIGILIGQHNDYGIDGFCPNVEIGGISMATANVVAEIAPFIIEASEQLDEGDIIVLEIQSHALEPMEVVQDIFDVIETAAANGIIVVEAGCNGNHNLDSDRFEGRFNPENRHSGAILVGAGNPPIGEWGPDRSRASFSNYGVRVDLQGWGWGIVTAGYGDLFFPNRDQRQWYCSNFGGTSGATPMIAGAAACIQGIYKERYQNEDVLSAVEIRDMLFETGSPQQDGPHGMGNIGPRPNLRAAIEFIPNVPGTLNGVVLDAESDSGIEGASVITDYGEETLTDENGEWVIENAMSDREFSITARKTGYNDSTFTELVLEVEGVLEVNFGLLHPDFALSDTVFTFNLDEGINEEEELTIENSGNGLLEWSVEKRLRNVDEIQPWELLGSHNIGLQVGDNRIEGVVFADQHFYVSGANNRNPIIYKMNREGAVVDSFSQVGENSRGLRDLAYDGVNLWGVETDMIYGFSPEGEFINSIQVPEGPLTGITWDPENELYWVTGLGSGIFGIDVDGNVIVEFENSNILIYGFAYRRDDPDDSPLYFLSRAPNNNNQIVGKMNPETGDTLLITQLEPEQGGAPGGAFISSIFNPLSHVFFNITNCAPNEGGDRIDIWHIEYKTAWMTLFPEEGEINPGSSEQLELIISTNDLIPQLYEGEFIFSHNALSNSNNLSITLEVSGSVPPNDFSLISPENEEILHSSEISFAWENSVDRNEDGEVEYVLWIKSANDSTYILTPASQIDLLLDTLDFNVEVEQDFQWWVIATSEGDSVRSREMFSFFYRPNSVSPDENEIPITFGFQSIYPNPFNANTLISFSLEKPGIFTLKLFDVNGREVKTFSRYAKKSGYYKYELHESNLNSGVYFVTLTSNNKSSVLKVALLK